MNELIRSRRAISQIIHILCTKCGEVIPVDNSQPAEVFDFEYHDEVLGLIGDVNKLYLTCPFCKERYDIPCKLKMY
jgi:hypothetical protein